MDLQAANPRRAAQFLALPGPLWDCIAEKAYKQDRVCLAATCRALRAASVQWFRSDDSDAFQVDTWRRNAAHGLGDEITAQHLAWLCRTQAPVHVALGNELQLLNTLAASGARIVELWTEEGCSLKPHVVMPALAGLTQLTCLTLVDMPIGNGWRHLPRQLQQMELWNCELEQVPAEFGALSQLSMLVLASLGEPIHGGWQHLPRQLQRLHLDHCSPQQLPVALAGLTQLRQLQLDGNRIQGGWKHLPRSLQQLDLSKCGLQQVPAQLSALMQLSTLNLSDNTLKGGWRHLPLGLQKFEVGSCGLQHVMAELAGLAQLTELCLSGNRTQAGWQHLPRQLQQLNLWGCQLQQVPAELAGRALSVNGLYSLTDDDTDASDEYDSSDDYDSSGSE